MQSSFRENALGLAGWLLISFCAAALGAVASINAGSFYEQLVRPDWAPPGWLFGPVWSLLYLMMGVAAWLVWKRRKQLGTAAVRGALTLFLVQLAVNALWTWLFFAWREGALAFVEIILLAGLILATMTAFWRIRPLAALLLLPYLLWVSFAMALTYAVWQGNPQILG